MVIAFGCDHAGFELKTALMDHASKKGYDVIDLGTYSSAAVDYPDYSEAVALAVRAGTADRGVLICGSGVGASVAANKVPGIRAGLCHDTYSARQGVEHDNVNVLVLGARVIGEVFAEELFDAFADARFSGEERHVRRLRKVREIESRFGHRFSERVDPRGGED